MNGDKAKEKKGYPHTYSGREKQVLTKRKPRLVEMQLATIGDGMQDEGMHQQVVTLVALAVALWHKLLEELLHTAQHLDHWAIHQSHKKCKFKAGHFRDTRFETFKPSH